MRRAFLEGWYRRRQLSLSGRCHGVGRPLLRVPTSTHWRSTIGSGSCTGERFWRLDQQHAATSCDGRYRLRRNCSNFAAQPASFPARSHLNARQTMVMESSINCKTNHGTTPRTMAPAIPTITAAISPGAGLIGSASSVSPNKINPTIRR